MVLVIQVVNYHSTKRKTIDMRVANYIVLLFFALMKRIRLEKQCKIIYLFFHAGKKYYKIDKTQKEYRIYR